MQDREIERSGVLHGSKSGNAGINSTNESLQELRQCKGRRRVAATSFLYERQLLKWANIADLIRIRGIGKQYSKPLDVKAKEQTPRRSRQGGHRSARSVI